MRPAKYNTVLRQNQPAGISAGDFAPSALPLGYVPRPAPVVVPPLGSLSRRFAVPLPSRSLPAPLAVLGSNAKTSPPRFAAPRRALPDPSTSAYWFQLQDAARSLLPEQLRLAGCLRWRHALAESVDVYRLAGGDGAPRAFYAGLQTCGSVWLCPCCARKICERRRLEIARALEQHKAAGGFAFLLTLTMAHYADDAPRATIKRLVAARALLFKGAGWDRWRLRLARLGSIRALDVTVGAHGLHPHFHELILLDRRPPVQLLDQFEDWLGLRWRRILARLGAWASASAGLNFLYDVQDAGYLAKLGVWSLSHEVAKLSSKRRRGVRGGSSLMALLHDAAAGDEEAGRLWAKNAGALKGERFLFWSKGLKEHFGIGEQEDEDLAANSETVAAEYLFSVDADDFRDLVAWGGGRGELLDRAAVDGVAALSWVREACESRAFIRSPGS